MTLDPSWILVWMVATSLVFQVLSFFRPKPGVVTVKRPPTPTGYSVDFIDESFEPPSEDDFLEMMGAGGAKDDGEG